MSFHIYVYIYIYMFYIWAHGAYVELSTAMDYDVIIPYGENRQLENLLRSLICIVGNQGGNVSSQHGPRSLMMHLELSNGFRYSFVYPRKLGENESKFDKHKYKHMFF